MENLMTRPTIKTIKRDPSQLGLAKLSFLLILIAMASALSSHPDELFRQIPIVAIAVSVLATYFYLHNFFKRVQASHRERLDQISNRDHLTGLESRQAFLTNLFRRLENAHMQNRPFAMLLVDIDRFKELDTIMGSENGDLLLQEFADRLRQYQTDSCFTSRLSGNEFAIVIDDLGNSKSFAERIEMLNAHLKQPYRFHGRPMDITISGGYVLFPDHGYRTGQLVQQAKMALLRAKQEGSNQICCFEQTHDVSAHVDHQLSQEMGTGITNGEFKLHYQPQICMSTGKLLGYEALMRWEHPVRGWVSPGTFIPIAERNGLILPLSEFALSEACTRAMSWKQPLRVAVNLSPIQFKRNDLVPTVERMLRITGLPPERLELEVTESLFIQTSHRTVEALTKLREMGVSVALDDFGTGYSSLSYLSAFPIDKIKLDRSFASDLAKNEGNMAIISAMIGIGKSLDIRIVAEGIEDKDTMELLRIAGCHEAQGYHLGRPRNLDFEPGDEMKEPVIGAGRQAFTLIRNEIFCA